MADVRACDECGTLFTQRREHARFCSARCRVAWNRQNTADPADPLSALNWAIIAMRETTERLSGVAPRDRSRAFAEISEAVWWITIVDATLIRHHPTAYDREMAARAPAARRLIEDTLAGLRYVRNQVNQETGSPDFVHPAKISPGEGDLLTAWTWNPVPEPSVAALLPRARQWELSRYHAYRARLAGNTIGDVFQRTSTFLECVAARVSIHDQSAAAADTSAHRS